MDSHELLLALPSYDEIRCDEFPYYNYTSIEKNSILGGSPEDEGLREGGEVCLALSLVSMDHEDFLVPRVF